MEFEKLPLHDATIILISYEWSAKAVSVVGNLYNPATQKISIFKILFTNASLINIPHAEEWGSSDSVLETVVLDASKYQIQMQSGDLITIMAESFSFELQH